MEIVRKQSSVEIAAKEIRDFLASSSLKEGDKLPPEVVMSQRLGVSRTTLREVYRQLQSEGYLELINGRGAFVRRKKVSFLRETVSWFSTNHGKLKDYLEVRLSFDPLAAQLAAERRTEEDVRILESIQDDFEKAVDRKDNVAMARFDAQFHGKITDMTRNELLIALVKIVNYYFEQTRKESFLLEEHALHAIAPHRAILKAIREKNPEAAAEESVKHMRQSLLDICGEDL